MSKERNIDIEAALTPLIEEYGEASVHEAVRRWYFPAVQRRIRKETMEAQNLRGKRYMLNDRG